MRVKNLPEGYIGLVDLGAHVSAGICKQLKTLTCPWLGSVFWGPLPFTTDRVEYVPRQYHLGAPEWCPPHIAQTCYEVYVQVALFA